MFSRQISWYQQNIIEIKAISFPDVVKDKDDDKRELIMTSTWSQLNKYEQFSLWNNESVKHKPQQCLKCNFKDNLNAPFPP